MTGPVWLVIALMALAWVPAIRAGFEVFGITQSERVGRHRKI